MWIYLTLVQKYLPVYLPSYGFNTYVTKDNISLIDLMNKWIGELLKFILRERLEKVIWKYIHHPIWCQNVIYL